MIAVNLVIVALLLLAAFLLLGMCRAAARADRAQERQARGTAVWNGDTQQWTHLPPGVQPGPSQYTAAQVTELDQLEVALAAPAFDPATDPQWAAGRARLLNDLNNQGDQ